MFDFKFKTNFNLNKLARNADKLIEEVMEDIGNTTIDSMQKIIKEAPYKPLSNTRKGKRQSGVGFPDTNQGVNNIGGSTPLLQSGSLFKSMSYRKGEGIHMNHYGLTHNDGVPDDIYPKLDPPQKNNVSMPPRPFIKIGLERVDLGKVEEVFQKKIHEYLRK